MSTDMSYYDILGLDKRAGVEEVRRAYRHLAIRCHPDKAGMTEANIALFVRMAQACDVLSNPHQRVHYDAGESVASSVICLKQALDLFSEAFPLDENLGLGDGSKGGGDLRVDLTLTPEDAAVGGQRVLRVGWPKPCTACGGSGIKAGPTPAPCTVCNGLGNTQVRSDVEVVVPPGIAHGGRVVLPGQGMTGSECDAPGDLIVVVWVANK